MQIVRGQRLKLSDVLGNQLTFNLAITIPATLSLDVALFGLDSQSKLSNEDYMIFYNQPKSPCGSLELKQNDSQKVSFGINLGSLNPQIERLVLTLTVDGTQTMAQLPTTVINLQNQQQTVTSFQLDGSMFNQEKALLALELYKKDHIWRMSAVGQGFNGGLAALIEYFGGEVAINNQPDNLISQSATDNPVNLKKVILTKSNSSINLKKKDGFGKISINLNWNRDRLKKVSNLGIDLDLGAFIALKDGGRDCIQAVGGQFGAFNDYPYLVLRNDDRSGQTKDGEWIDINGKHWDKVEEVLIYAFIYSGIPHWQETDAIVTIQIEGQQPIETQLTEGNNQLGMCAIARLTNENGAIKVERINRYFNSHQSMDNAFDWGFSWVRGCK